MITKREIKNNSNRTIHTTGGTNCTELPYVVASYKQAKEKRQRQNDNDIFAA